MWWRLGVLAAASIGLLVLLFMPIHTVDVVVEMPRVRGGGAVSADDLEALLSGVVTVGTVLFLAGYGALVLWIGRRIVRRHGRKARGASGG